MDDEGLTDGTFVKQNAVGKGVILSPYRFCAALTRQIIIYSKSTVTNPSSQVSNK